MSNSPFPLGLSVCLGTSYLIETEKFLLKVL